MDNVNVINNWFYFSLNYVSDYCKEYGDYIPTFITKVNWSCDMFHIADKWKEIERNSGYGRMNMFFAELDSTNRRKLIEWVNENYDCKMHI